jgi:hypothetical protein
MKFKYAFLDVFLEKKQNMVYGLCLCLPEDDRLQEAGESCIITSFKTCKLTGGHVIRMIKSRRMRWVGHVARTEEMNNAYKILVMKPEGKRPFGRPRSRWEIILE